MPRAHQMTPRHGEALADTVADAATEGDTLVDASTLVVTLLVTDTLAVALRVAATDAVTLPLVDADVVCKAVTEADTDEDAATLGDTDAELDTHRHVYLHGGESGRAAAARWAAAAARARGAQHALASYSLVGLRRRALLATADCAAARRHRR